MTKQELDKCLGYRAGRDKASMCLEKGEAIQGERTWLQRLTKSPLPPAPVGVGSHCLSHIIHCSSSLMENSGDKYRGTLRGMYLALTPSSKLQNRGKQSRPAAPKNIKSCIKHLPLFLAIMLRALKSMGPAEAFGHLLAKPFITLERLRPSEGSLKQ